VLSANNNEFKIDKTITYLNHAAVGVWPQSTRDAVCQFADENLHVGAANYPKWMQVETALRAQFQKLLNAASSDDIALVKNTSEALSFVAYGLPWREGDEVVTLAEEFPSNRVVWESLADKGVTTRQISLSENWSAPEEALIAAMSDRTRLLSVSSVQYASGFQLDLHMLGEACKQRGILFCVDAIQSLGVVPIDVQAINADFVMADGHKWMLGPEGVAVFYSHPDARDKLSLTQYGWHMLEHMHDFDNPEWHPATSARRFECGSPNMLGIHALHASLELLLETGIENIHQSILTHARRLHEIIHAHPALQLLSSDTPDRYAGIVTFAVEGQDQNHVYQSLMSNKVICALRGGGIRFSPHFYTPENKLTHAFDVLEDIISS